MALRAAHTDGRRGRLRASESVAGWIFADLLLVLFIVGLGTAIPQEIEPPKPPPKPRAEPEPEIIGMNTTSTKVTVNVKAPDALLGAGAAASTARRATCEEIRGATNDLTSKGAEAALVMIFGGNPGEPSPGQRVAAAIGQQLNCASPSLFPKDSFGPGKTASPAEVASGRDITGVVRPFWNGRLPYGRAELEIFVFTTQERNKKQ